MSKYEEKRKEQTRWKASEPMHDEREHFGTSTKFVQFDFDATYPASEQAVLIRHGERMVYLSTAEAIDLARILIEWCADPAPKEFPHA